VLCLAVALTACDRAEPPPTVSEPVAHPDPASLPADLQARIAELRTRADAGQAEAWGELGALYLAQERMRAAETCLRNARHLDDDPRWAYQLGFLHQARGELDRAEAAFGAALRLDPRLDAARLRLGDVLLAAGRPEEASAAFGAALERAPHSDYAEWGLGRAALLAGDAPGAIAHLERALLSQPIGSVVHYSLGQALRRAGRLEEAQAQLEQAGDVRVGFLDPFSAVLGRAAAETALDAVVALSDRAAPWTDEELRFTRGRLDGLLDAAARVAAASEGRTPVSAARLLVVAGLLREESGAGDDGLRHLELAAELAADEPLARRSLGTALARRGRSQAALPHLAAAYRLTPGDDDTRLQLATVQLELGLFAEALPALTELVSARPEDARRRLRLADALAGSGRSVEAVAAYEHALAGELPDRERAAASFRLATELLALGRSGVAVAHARRATELLPDAPGAWQTLAVALARAGRLDQAVAPFREVVRLAPSHPPGQLGLSLALIELGQLSEARRQLEAAVVAIPGETALCHRLARLLAIGPGATPADGERALALVSRLMAERPTAARAATLALALARVGRFDEAIEVQRRVIAAGSDDADARRRLEAFQSASAWQARSPTEVLAGE